MAFIYGVNMGVSFIAPLMAGLVADRYGLPAALDAIAIFPLLAAIICFLVVKPAAQPAK